MLQKNSLQTISTKSAEEGFEIDLLALAGALWRGKFTIVCYALIALGIGIWHSHFVAVPTFRSNVSLALELRSEPLGDIQAVISGVSTDTAAMNTEVDVIQSRGILQQVVDKLNLVEDPEFNPSLRPEPALLQWVSDLVVQVRGEQETLAHPEQEQITLNHTIDNLRDAITAGVKPNTYIFNISVTTQSPAKSRLIANTLAETYIADQIDQKFSATENAVSWLSERVVELEQELLERENALKGLRSEIDVVSFEGVEALNRQLIDARDRASGAAAALAIAEARLSRIVELREAEDYAQLAEFLNDNTLSSLVRSDATNSAIQSRLDTLERQAEIALARQRQQVDTLDNSVTRLEAEVEAKSEDFIRLQQVEREMQATRTLYETFLTRLKEATVQRGMAQSDSRVLSEAILGEYLSPRKTLIAILALMLGLMVGSAVVLAKQFLNRGFRSAAELEADTGRSVIGQIPLMPIKQRDQLITYLDDKPASAAAEAIRNLRTSILLSSPSNPPRIIMSTSSLPGEGKTTLSISLAHNLAGLNKRVLLIEGDVRRRTLGEYFHTNTDARGIVAALEGKIDLSDLVVRDPRVNMDVLLGEKSSLNAADLFSSDRFKEFLAELRSVYDYVVIDTPPVLVVPDARIIAQHVDAVIFNVAWDQTSRDQVKEALRQFSNGNVDIDGLVLSRINLSGLKRYGYGGKHGTYAAYGSSYYDT